MSLESAQRVLHRAQQTGFILEDAMVIAAAARIAPGASLPADPALALVAAAARGAAWPELESIARTVPVHLRESAAHAAEHLLAQRDPVQTWRFLGDMLGDELLRDGLLCGLSVAARLNRETTQALLGAKLSANETFASQWRADQAGRDRADLLTAHPAPCFLDLPASSCAPLLIGTALADIEHGFALVETMTGFYSPGEIQLALDLFALIAARSGQGVRLTAMATEGDEILERIGWTRAAAMAGVLAGDALAGSVCTLATQIGEEVDPCDEADAALDLAVALVAGGAVEACAWAPPPAVLPALATTLFDAGPVPTKAVIAALKSWPGAGDAGPQPWEDVLHLARALPWRPVPGTLADILGVPGF